MQRRKKKRGVGDGHVVPRLGDWGKERRFRGGIHRGWRPGKMGWCRAGRGMGTWAGEAGATRVTEGY